MSDVRNLIIIGSGPAGLTAAIYAARADLKPLLFEGVSLGGPPGGQLVMTTEIENFPGFPEGVMGPDLMGFLKKQALRFGTDFVAEDVTSVDFSKTPLTVVSEDMTYAAHSVILATGAQANWMNIPSEQSLRGYGVSACATCDGFFFKGKEVVVVGGGDTALEEAHFLTRFASRVTMVHRRDALRGSKIMQERVFANKKIVFVWNSVIEEIRDPAQKKVTGVLLKNVVSGAKTLYPCQGVFIAIGHTPNTHVFRGAVDLDEKGYLRISNGTETSVPGVFASGDIQDARYRQAITAAGSGCMAALDAEKYLNAQGLAH